MSAFTSLTAWYRTLPSSSDTNSVSALRSGRVSDASIVVSLWFPPTQRAAFPCHAEATKLRSHGNRCCLPHPDPLRMARPLSMFRGWGYGAAVWYTLFPRFSREKPGVSPGNSQDPQFPSAPSHGFPWRIALGTAKACWPCSHRLLLLNLCVHLFPTWFHTFLVGDAFQRRKLVLSRFSIRFARCRPDGRAASVPGPGLGLKWARGRSHRRLGLACLFI